jgi:membrane protease YdiL (CAAX protease family)
VRDRLSISIYVLALIASEVILAFVSLPAGILAYAGLLVVLVNHYAGAVGRMPPHSSERAAPPALLALSLVPLIHIAALSAPVAGATGLEQQAIVAGSLLPALALATWVMRPPLRLPSGAAWLVDAAAAATGAALGLAAYLLVRGEGFAVSARASAVVAAVLVVSLAGFVEELTFRGLIQTSLQALYPRSSPLWSTALFAVSYAGTRPVSYVFLVAGVGLAFAVVVRATRSLVGVVLGHAFFNIGLFLLWPRILA